MHLYKALVLAGLTLSLAAGPLGAAEKSITISTTTSTRDSGLLDVLLPALQQDTGIEVKVIAKGTGAAIRDGIDGNVDAIFVHDTPREEAFVADGYGTKRYAVMHNDFILAGPASDKAGIKGSDAAEALKKIAAAKTVFVSRGDDSGTHAKEQELWKASGLTLETSVSTLEKDGKQVEITPFFNLVHVLNPGAAFSFLAGASGWQRYFFITLGLLVAVWLIRQLKQTLPRFEAVGYSLILGGALGNVVDRLLRGQVVDFLDFHWQGMHWPAFNLAEVAISIGVGCLIARFLEIRDKGNKGRLLSG